MRRWVIAAAGLLATMGWLGCGGADDHPGPDDSVPPDEPRCLSCDSALGADEQEILRSKPKVVVTPAELMFYPTNLESAEFQPKEVVVTNKTNGLVFVTKAYVSSGLSPMDPKEEDNHFAVSNLADTVALAKGACVSLWVSFLGSSEQQNEVLIIRTTDPYYHTLAVELAGKFFLDPIGD